MNNLNPNVKEVLFTQEQILQKVEELAHHLNKKYQTSTKPVVVVGILKGCTVFLGQLLTRLSFDLELDFLWVNSYTGTNSQELNFRTELSVDVKDRHVLLVEDIVDNGQTLSQIVKMLKDKNPASLYTVVMVDKVKQRAHEFSVDCSLFQIEDKWVIGYGLDTDGKFRNLPYIGVYNQGN